MAAIGDPQVRALTLAAHRIDATTMSIGVWNRFRDRPNLKVLLSAEDYLRSAPILNKVIVGEESTLVAKRSAVERFVAAIIKASRAFASNPNTWVAAMAQARPDVSKAELDDLAGTFARSWSVNGGLYPAHVAYSVEQHYREEGFRQLRRIDADEFLDTKPIAAVLGRIGVIPGLDPNIP